MPAKGSSGRRRPDPQDRDLWRRSQASDAPQNETERFLDLAAFADNRLDEEETARIAELVARDPGAASDVAVARALAKAVPIVDENVVSRAAALVAEKNSVALVVTFPVRPQAISRPWYSAVGWSGLAAAIVLAGWLGFDLGSGVDRALPLSPSASEIPDSALPLVRDFTEGWQT